MYYKLQYLIYYRIYKYSKQITKYFSEGKQLLVKNSGNKITIKNYETNIFKSVNSVLDTINTKAELTHIQRFEV